IESLAGGTFTITDLSGEEVFHFLPLINQGQSAILGVGAEVFLPPGRDGMFTLTLAFDHSLSEGRQAARFLKELSNRLQHYEATLGRLPSAESASEEPCCCECLRPL